MKKIINQILLPLILILLAGSCNDEPDYYTLSTPADQMHLTASSESVVLQRVDETKEAIKFTWDKAADRGAETEVIYYFRLYHAEMKSLESELIKLDKDSRSVSLTVRELNNILHSWNIVPGDEITIEAEILAVVESSPKYLKPEVSTTHFNIIGYEPSNKLYLMVENGGQKRTLEMKMTGEGIFKWSGELGICNFWFTRDSEKGFPSYMKGESENSLVYSETGEGNPLSITEAGIYSITINTNELTTSALKLPSQLYLITSKNGVEQVRALNKAQAGRSVFYLKDVFEEGTEFRFAKEADVTWPAYVKGSSNTELALKEEGAEMFKVSKTATYVMTVNIEDLNLIFLDVYKLPTGTIAVVGAVIPNVGWDAGAAIRSSQLAQKDLINKPEVISYTGRFETKPSGSNDDNSFKFVGDAGWNGGFWAPKANANPFNSNEQSLALNDASGDNKWRLPSGTESGTYTVEINLHTMKIKLVKK